MTDSIRFGYADPPYPGQARKSYGDHPDFGGEVDHAGLIAQLEKSEVRAAILRAAVEAHPGTLERQDLDVEPAIARASGQLVHAQTALADRRRPHPLRRHRSDQRDGPPPSGDRDRGRSGEGCAGRVIGRRYRIGNRPDVWICRARGEPFDRGPRRNVLLVNERTGEFTIRPFRGCRRA